MNPTTSTRFNPLMPAIIRHFGLRAGRRQGRPRPGSAPRRCRRSAASISRFSGGGARSCRTRSRRSSAVAWNDLVAHYRLVKLRVEELGPLVVGIDSKGNSLFDQLQAIGTGSPRHDPARARGRSERIQVALSHVEKAKGQSIHIKGDYCKRKGSVAIRHSDRAARQGGCNGRVEASGRIVCDRHRCDCRMGSGLSRQAHHAGQSLCRGRARGPPGAHRRRRE